MSDSDNKQFTERSVNEPPPTQMQELGEHHDVAPLATAAVVQNSYGPLHKNFNLEKFTLNGVLQREYPIGNYAWPSSAGINAEIARLNFPKLLFDQKFIKAKLGDFKYFRSGIQFTFRVVSNKFAYGKFMASWTPFAHQARDLNEALDAGYASGLHHVIGSVSAGEAVNFFVPFVSPYRALDLNNWDDKELGQLNIIVLNPLRMTDGTAHTASIFVTAAFVDAEAFLPSSYVVPESIGEADAKAALGTISDIADSGRAIKNIVDNPLKVAPYVDFMSKALPAAAELMAINKPMTLQQSQVVGTHPLMDYNYGMGISQAPKMSIDPKCAVGTDPIAAIPIDEMDLSVIAATPMLCSILEIPSYNMQTHVVNDLEYGSRTYLDFLAANFKYCQGSRKYKIYISASLFHSVRLVFWVNHESSKDTGNWQDCYHKFLDVQGDTELSFSIPYLSQHFGKIAKDVSKMHLYVKVLSWNQPDAAKACPIWLNVYKAADVDMEFYGYLDKSFEVESCPRADFVVPFDDFIPNSSLYRATNVTHGERVRSLAEILHKYHPISSYNGTTFRAYNAATYTDGGKQYYIGPEKFGVLYYFWKGAMCFLFTHREAGSRAELLYTYVGSADPEYFVNADISSDMNPHLRAEIPYYQRDAFLTTSNNHDLTTMQFVGFTHTPAMLHKACGDDFRFMFLKPFSRKLTVVNTPAGHGVKKMINFYQS